MARSAQEYVNNLADPAYQQQLLNGQARGGNIGGTAGGIGGALLGTLLAPGIGTIAGAGLGAALGNATGQGIGGGGEVPINGRAVLGAGATGAAGGALGGVLPGVAGAALGQAGAQTLLGKQQPTQAAPSPMNPGVQPVMDPMSKAPLTDEGRVALGMRRQKRGLFG
jgi:hypothetical protein